MKTPEKLFSQYERGIITQHEVVGTLYEQNTDEDILPDNWKKLYLEFCDSVGGKGKKLISWHL